MSLLLMVPFAAVALLSTPGAVAGSWQDTAWDMAGWGCFLLGATLRWWSTLYIGGRKSAMLIDAGPYSLCRNPLYLGTLLLCLAVAAFMQSPTLAAGVAVAAVYYLSVTVPAEERFLSQRLGQPYLDYLARVPRYWPRLRGFQSAEVLEVPLKGLVAEAWRFARWALIPILCELVNHARLASWWPHWQLLP